MELKMPLIYSDEFTQVFYKAGNGNFTLVTFSELTFIPDGRNFWAQSLVEKLGLECLSFVSIGHSWYPESSMRRAISAAMPFLLGKKTVSYAASMGAYASLRYGELLDIDVTIAVTPQWSISPEDAPYEWRFTDYYNAAINGDMRIKPCSQYFSEKNSTFIFYDPYDLADCEHTKRISSATPQVVTIPVYYMEHACIFALSGSQSARKIFDAALMGDRKSMLEIARRGKKRTVQYRTEIIKKLLLFKHMKWAARNVDYLMSNLGYGNEQFISLVVQAIQGGQNELAHLLAGELIRVDPRNIEAYHRLAEALRNMGKPQNAVESLKVAARIFPDEKHIHGHLGIALQEAKEFSEAVEAFEVALSIDHTMEELNLRRNECIGKISEITADLSHANGGHIF